MNETVALVLRIALQALSDRALTFIVFAAFVGMAIYAMTAPDYHRDGIVAFIGFLYVYTLKKERHHAQSVQTQNTDGHNLNG